MSDVFEAVAEHQLELNSSEYYLFSAVALAAWRLRTDEVRVSWELFQALSGLSRTSIYTVLQKLEARGFLIACSRRVGPKPITYRVPCLTPFVVTNAGLRPDPVPLGNGSNFERLEPPAPADSTPLVPVGNGSNFERLAGQNPANGSNFEPSATIAYKNSLTHSLTSRSHSERVSECTVPAVSATCLRVAEMLKSICGFDIRVNDPLLAKTAAHLNKISLSLPSLGRYLRHVVERKRRAGYRIESFGALVKWSITDGDLIAWCNQQDARMLELDALEETGREPAANADEMPPAARVAILRRLLDDQPNHLQAAEWRAEMKRLEPAMQRAAGGAR